MLYLPTVLVIYALLQISIDSVTNASKLMSFDTYLIHRDSPESPFYDSSLNQSDIVERALSRSMTRLSHLNSLIKLPNNFANKMTVHSTILASTNYLMEFFVGTPPVKQLAIADTASQIVWTQCLPCVNCFNQTQPKFNPMESSSYHVLPCDSKECQELGKYDIRCEGKNTKCQYNLNYMDNSSSSGDLAFETFTLGKTSFQRMVYGCGNNNTGRFDPSSAGVVGLGGGFNSLVTKLGDQIGGKFSYCLTSKINTRSKIKFGSNAIMSGCGWIYRCGSIYTPLFLRSPLMFYFITLEAISLGVTKISMHGDKPIKNGNFLIDSGSTASYLPRDMYQELENALRNSIQATPVQHPTFKLCYMDYTNFKIPTIIFHFSGGLDLAFTIKTSMVYTRGLLCLGILPSKIDGLGVLGSNLQMDYLIEYDIKKERVSFRPTDCSKI
ncbi:aspartic proteinase CDR1-like [Impatiens glandulifera]|uniref:aspartic proteinase CDR1-like n=1 Tax=Impatiens glandulifera TaxID=253017 RepID=UPI001FB177E2|nr:aspartic proteinase CDR1-like [Impatiens glandulifera]XP_047331088.1 aspartic proteinase CDR1-like [Impatiens glandulifera]